MTSEEQSISAEVEAVVASAPGTSDPEEKPPTGSETTDHDVDDDNITPPTPPHGSAKDNCQDKDIDDIDDDGDDESEKERKRFRLVAFILCCVLPLLLLAFGLILWLGLRDRNNDKNSSDSAVEAANEGTKDNDIIGFTEKRFVGDLQFAIPSTFEGECGFELSDSQVAVLQTAILQAFGNAVEISPDFDDTMLAIEDLVIQSGSVTETFPNGCVLDVDSLGSFLSSDGSVEDLEPALATGDPSLEEVFISELIALLETESLFNGNVFSDNLDFSISTNLNAPGFTTLTSRQVQILENAMLDSFEAAVMRSFEYDGEELALLNIYFDAIALFDTTGGADLNVDSMGIFLSSDGSYDKLDTTKGDPDLMELFLGELSGRLNDEQLFNGNMFSGDLIFAIMTTIGTDGEETELSSSQVLVLENAMIQAMTLAVEKSRDYGSSMLQMLEISVSNNSLSPTEAGTALDVVSSGVFISSDATFNTLDVSLGDPDLLQLFLVELAVILGESALFTGELPEPIAFYDELQFTIMTGLGSASSEQLTVEQIGILEGYMMGAFATAVDRSEEYDVGMLQMLSTDVLNHALRQTDVGIALDVTALSLFLSIYAAYEQLDMSRGQPDLMTLFISELTELLSRENLFNRQVMFEDQLMFSVMTNLAIDGSTELSPAQITVLEESILEAFSLAVSKSTEYDGMLEMMSTTVQTAILQVSSTRSGDVFLSVEAIGNFISPDGTFSQLDMTRGDPTLLELFLIELTSILAEEPLFSQEEPGPKAFYGELDFTVQTALQTNGQTELSSLQIEFLESVMVVAFEVSVSKSTDYTDQQIQIVVADIENTLLTEGGPGGTLLLEVQSLNVFVSVDGSYLALDTSRGDPTLLEIFIEEMSSQLAEEPLFSSTLGPTKEPTPIPTTRAPTAQMATLGPTLRPPTTQPSPNPSTTAPTQLPSPSPTTLAPTPQPSPSPTTREPTPRPTIAVVPPTLGPVLTPTVTTLQPVLNPTVQTLQPVLNPTIQTVQPILNPTIQTLQPVLTPTLETVPSLGPVLNPVPTILNPTLGTPTPPALGPILGLR